MKFSPSLSFWLHTIGFAIPVYVLALGYTAVYQKELNFISFSEAVAFTAGILLGCSFALSGLGYFLNIFDTKLKYRKQLGLLGYYLALIYSFSLMIQNPDRYWKNILTTVREPEALLGIFAMGILTIMAIISANWAVKAFGRHWRPLLRLGYLAYVALIVRAVILEGGTWLIWGQNMVSVPPPRMLLTLFALSVIYLRVVLEIDLRLTKKPPIAVAPTTKT